MKTILSYFWVIFVASTSSIPVSAALMHTIGQLPPPFHSGYIVLFNFILFYTITLLAMKVVGRDSGIHIKIESPPHRWIGKEIEWEVVGDLYDNCPIIKCRLAGSQKPYRYLKLWTSELIGAKGYGRLDLIENRNSLTIALTEQRPDHLTH